MEEKDLINEWDIIDTFFRDTEYYKSQHQIDSFDEFIFSDQNGLKNIVQRENPFILFKGETKGKGDFAYEIKIYYGETLDEEGNIIHDKQNIFVSSPIEICFVLDAITFSIKVEPHLGTPIINIGFILLLFILKFLFTFLI